MDKAKSQPKFDHIPNRIEFIHSLLKDKKLEPLIDVKTKSSDNLIILLGDSCLLVVAEHKVLLDEAL